MPLEPGQSLAHYRIVRQIGQGGMGAVFLAEDTKLDRPVALKLLPPETSSDPGRLERFQREAKAVAALNHPNIVTIYSVEEEAGKHFLTMELVEGESLDHGLPATGLPLDRVFHIGIALADALAAAHEKGIIHRDLKPANVMVTRDGRVKVLDFGLAKLAVGPATPASGSAEVSAALTMQARDPSLTDAGRVVGTAPYMSPEQVKGQSVDVRSDIFSLGVVLYELATGRRPFGGDSPAETISSILRDIPRRVTEARHDVPRHLERIIDHCLKKDPRERFQTARDVLNQLRDLHREVESGPLAVDSGPSVPQGGPPVASPATSSPGSYPTPPASGATLEHSRSRAWAWMVGGAAVVLVAFLAFWMGTRRGDEAAASGSAASAKAGGGVSSTTIDSIAVLPFAVPSGDVSDDFLGDGIAENVTNNLTTLPGLRVVPRSVAFRARGRDDELEAVGKDLGVRAIVTGRVNRRDDRLIVGVELTDVSRMSQIWGDRFDTPIDKILTVESAIASRITDALRIEISDEDARRAIKRYTEVPAAHLAYMEARHAWGKRSPGGFRTALELYDKAIAADPNFALAHAGKAETYVLMTLYLGPPAEYAPLLQPEVDEALRLDPDLAQAYPAQGFALAIEGSTDAENAFRRAIELDPDYATAHHWLGVWLGATGAPDAGLPQLEQARRLDPGSAIIATDIGNALMTLGRLEEAEKTFNEVLEADPTFGRALDGLVNTYLQTGRYQDAIQTYERVAGLTGEIAWTDGMRAMLYARAGDMDRAREELRRMEQRAADGSYVSPFGFARAYMGMGDMERCFQWLDRAFTARDPLLMVGMAGWYPDITADPRWPALEARMNDPKSHG